MPTINLSIKVIPQGLYDKNNDSLITEVYPTVNLWSLTSGTKQLSGQSTAVLNRYTFKTQMSYSYAGSASADRPLYIQVTLPNHIEIWSSTSIIFNQSVTSNYNYDFTIAQTKTLGDNSINVSTSSSRFAMFVGDLNNDGIIDTTDLSTLENNMDIYAITP